MKKIIIMFILLSILGVSKNGAFAATIDLESNDEESVFENALEQGEIDRRLEVVFDYLNEHANNDFNGLTSIVYDIPVGEGVVVNAEISNQEVLKIRTLGRSTYSLKAKTTYNYNLTLTNVVGSGDKTVYTVNYTTSNSITPDKVVYGITVNSVSIAGTPPSGFTLGNKYTYIGSHNGTISVSTEGYIIYKRILLSDKTINFNDVTFSSHVDGKLVVDYSYDVN